jgi:hypothetical protein
VGVKKSKIIKQYFKGTKHQISIIKHKLESGEAFFDVVRGECEMLACYFITFKYAEKYVIENFM